jgi:hypothetical protein
MAIRNTILSLLVVTPRVSGVVRSFAYSFSFTCLLAGAHDEHALIIFRNTYVLRVFRTSESNTT